MNAIRRSESTTAPLAAELADLGKTIATLRKPASLQLAERELKRLREVRAEISRRYRANLDEIVDRASISRLPPSVEAIRLELEEADAAIRKASIALNTARAEFGPAIEKRLAPHRAAAARAVLEAIGILDGARALLEAADSCARRNGIEARSFLPDTEHLAICAMAIAKRNT
jgi:hypothetical protein